jgi:hypothetical protein
MRGIQNVKDNLLFSLIYKRYITNILQFFDVIPWLLHTFVTPVHEFPDVICEECVRCMQSQLCTVSLSSSSLENLRPHTAFERSECMGNRWARRGLWCVGEKLEFSFRNLSKVAAAVSGRVLSWYKTTWFVSISLRLLQTAGFSSSRIAQSAHYWLSVQVLVVLEDGPNEVPKQRQHHFADRMHTFEFLDPGWWRVFPLHALTFACRFVVMQPCFIACDNSLQERHSFFTISLQKCSAV